MEAQLNPFLQYTNLNVGAPPVQDQPWTGGAAHIINAATNIIANNKIARLAKKIKAYIPTAKHKVANTYDESYVSNQILEKEKQNLYAQGQQNLTANNDANLAQQNLINDKVSDITDKQALLTAESTKRRIAEEIKTENYNNSEAIDAFNTGQQNLLATEKYRTNADMSRILSNAKALTSAYKDFITDRGEHQKTEKENALTMYKHRLLTDASNQERQMYNDYKKRSDIGNQYSLLNNFISELNSELLDQEPTGLSNYEIQVWKEHINDAQPLLNPEFKQVVLKLVKGQSNAAQRYRAEHQHNVQKLNEEFYIARNILNRRTKDYETLIPYKITNDASFYFKEGGKIKALKALLQHQTNQNKLQAAESKEVAALNKDYHKRASKELSDALRSINKEQEMLLKTIFS